MDRPCKAKTSKGARTAAPAEALESTRESMASMGALGRKSRAIFQTTRNEVEWGVVVGLFSCHLIPRLVARSTDMFCQTQLICPDTATASAGFATCLLEPLSLLKSHCGAPTKFGHVTEGLCQEKPKPSQPKRQTRPRFAVRQRGAGQCGEVAGRSQTLRHTVRTLSITYSSKPGLMHKPHLDR